MNPRPAAAAALNQIFSETKVWVAEEPDHLIHLNGERFLGPYPDVAGGGDKPQTA